MYARIVGALAAVAVTSTLVTGAFALYYSYEALKHQKQQDELSIARNIAVQVDESLSRARQTVEALAALPVFSSPHPAAQREALTLVTRVTEIIDGIAAVDALGRVVAMDGAEPATAGLLPREGGPWLLRQAGRGGAARFSEVYWSGDGEPRLAISAGTSGGGALSGVVALRRHSLGGVEDIRIGKTGYAYLVDSAGRVLVHPQRRRIMENLRDHPPVSAFLAGREGVIEFTNQEGLQVLAAFAPISSTGWGVVVRQPTSESYAYAQRIRWVMSAAFLISLLASLALGARLAARVSRPLADLAAGAQRIAAGDLTWRLGADGPDELSRLARAFDEMASSLQLRLQEIERAHARVLATERDLARSERLAAVGQLAAGLAHEINNPLNVMSGFCELLAARTPTDDPRRSAVDEVLRESQRCQRLVRDLLDYARPRETRREPVSLAALVEDAMPLIRSQPLAAGVRVSWSAEPGLPEVHGDPDQLKQLLLNLCLNALQALEGRGTLTVTASRTGEDAALRVADDGPGMDSERLARVFEPFHTTKEAGLGLGLALCRSISQAHGGSIAVESAPGRGAVFTVRIPLPEAAHALA
jgi:two-component system, NtrC family, sensor kinase